MSGLFAEINSGAFKLKHVTDDQKAYKQKKEELGPVSFEDLERRKAEAEARRAEKEKEKAAAEAAEAAAASSAKAATTKAPVFTLESDKRWVVANQIGTALNPINLVIDETRMHHAVFINNCEHVYLNVLTKINSVIVLDSKKVQIQLKSVVAQLEVTNSSNIDCQVAEALPSVNLGNTHTVNLFLMHPTYSRETEVVTASCSGVNINFPHESDESEMIERAVPEQFVSKLVPNGKGGYKMETKPSDMFT